MTPTPLRVPIECEWTSDRNVELVNLVMTPPGLTPTTVVNDSTVETRLVDEV